MGQHMDKSLHILLESADACSGRIDEAVLPLQYQRCTADEICKRRFVLCRLCRIFKITSEREKES